MPKLPEYTAPVGAVSPSGGRRATAEDFGVGTGLESAGHAVQKAATEYMQEAESQEARKALVASTQIRADYARKLDEATLSGADVGTLKEQMLNDLSKVGESFQTKKGQEQLQLYTANSELMYDEQANRIKVQRAWSTARLDGQKFVNGASALIQSNPAYLAVAEKNAAEFVSTFPGIRPDQRAELTDRLTKDLNMAAAVSATRINPEDARKRLEAGEWNLEPHQRQIALDKAHSEMQAKRAEESYIRMEAERQKHEADSQGRDAGFASIINGTFSRRAIMDDPRLLPATREHLILLAEARAKEFANQEKRSDPATKKALFLALTAPEGDPARTYNADGVFTAVRDGRLNTTDANWLNGIAAQQKDENGRAIGQKLNAMVGNMNRAFSQDPKYTAQPNLVAAIENHYVEHVYERVAELRKANENPNKVFDPTSRDYVGSAAFIQQSVDAVKSTSRPVMPSPKTQAEYDALPPGTVYVDTDGAIKTKGGKPAVNTGGATGNY